MIPHFLRARVPAFCDSTVNEGTHEAGRSLSRNDARRCLSHPNACRRLLPRDWAALVDDNPSVLTTKDFSERAIRTAPPKERVRPDEQPKPWRRDLGANERAASRRLLRIQYKDRIRQQCCEPFTSCASRADLMRRGRWRRGGGDKRRWLIEAWSVPLYEYSDRRASPNADFSTE